MNRIKNNIQFEQKFDIYFQTGNLMVRFLKYVAILIFLMGV